MSTHSMPDAEQTSGEDSFPRLWARTRRWTLGEPRTITVIDRADGSARILFLRALAGDDPRTALLSVDVDPAGRVGPERLLVDPAAGGDGELSQAERARRERVRESAAGVVSYSHDAAGRQVLAVTGARAVLVDADAGSSDAAREVALPDGAFDPQLDPTGSRVGFCLDSGLFVLDLRSGDVGLLAEDEADAISWGIAEHAAAEEMNRSRGYWWSPDGAALLAARVDESNVPEWWISDPSNPDARPRPVRYPQAGSPNARVSLWRFELDGSAAIDRPVELRWDAAGFEYLARVIWSPGHPPLIGVQSRDQQHVQWRVAAPDGSTDVLAEDTSDCWVELFAGSPAWLGDDLVRIADRDGVRRLLIGEDPVSPDDMHVRSIAGTTATGVVVTANTGGDPTSIGCWLLGRDAPAEAITERSGVHVAETGGRVSVISSQALDQDGLRVTVRVDGDERGELARAALPMPYAPSVSLFRTESGVSVGLVLPRERVGAALPVLVSPYGGPHFQRVLTSRRAWLEEQWWADQGFAVVVADGRGTPGVSVPWEQAVRGDQATPVLADQIEALHAAAKHGSTLGVDLDLDRVAIRGWSFGGSLSAWAVIRHPEVFHAGVVGAPNADPALYDTHYTERYLGQDVTAESYRLSSVLTGAETLRRPMLIVHGLADDNVVVAHSLRLSQALTAAGRPHSLLPLPGITHMTAAESVTENLLLLQLDFIRRALGLSPVAS